MRVIDARSGEEVVLGATIQYPDGETLKLLDIDEGLLSATAFVERHFKNFVTGQWMSDRTQIPLVVQFFHPRFFLRKVAFIPS